MLLWPRWRYWPWAPGATPEDRLLGAGHAQLTSAEITAAFAGNTILGKGQVSDYAIYYANAAELRGRITWEDNAATDRGVWEVTGDNLYCRRWLERWGNLERQCWRIYRNGRHYHLGQPRRHYLDGNQAPGR